MAIYFAPRRPIVACGHRWEGGHAPGAARDHVCGKRRGHSKRHACFVVIGQYVIKGVECPNLCGRNDFTLATPA